MSSHVALSEPIKAKPVNNRQTRTLKSAETHIGAFTQEITHMIVM